MTLNEGDRQMTDREQYVEFYLPTRYFQVRPDSNGMCRDTCVTVMHKAFGTDPGCMLEFMRNNFGGFSVLCTAEQFGRFIIHRHKLGNCINGVRDLAPKFVHKPADPVTETVNAIVAKSGVEASYVRTVLDSLDRWEHSSGRTVLHVIPGARTSWSGTQIFKAVKDYDCN